MRYLYPRSTRYLKYSASTSRIFSLPTTIFSFLMHSNGTLPFFKFVAFQIFFTFRTLTPSNFTPKSVCWINSRARWVFRDFHFSRGVIKPLLTSGSLTGFRPNAW